LQHTRKEKEDEKEEKKSDRVARLMALAHAHLV
jgi:hypothetical protein